MDEARRSSVTIENVTMSDSGTYVCIAENSVGSIQALSFVRIRGELLVKSQSGPLIQLSTNILIFYICSVSRASGVEG